MNQQELLAKFEELGVLLNGHFKLTSGLHSKQYMQCAKLFECPKQAGEVLKHLITHLPEGIETVIAPAIGGVTVGYEIARQLGCRFVFAERQDGKMTFRRGFQLTPSEKVIAVEDVITTGGSVKEVIDLAKESGAEVLGVATVVDRSQGKADFDMPLTSLITMEIEVFEPESCPLCAEGMEIQSPGSRQQTK